MILHYQVYTQEDDNNNECANINLFFRENNIKALIMTIRYCKIFYI